MSMIRLAIGVIPMTLLAMYVFDFNLYDIGFPLIAFFCNLIFTSWSVGIFVSGLVLRHGPERFRFNHSPLSPCRRLAWEFGVHGPRPVASGWTLSVDFGRLRSTTN